MSEERQTLEQALDENFRDGTLARSVQIIASTIPDQIESSVLGEAADRLKTACAIIAAARTLIAKLDECAPGIDDAFLHLELRYGPYEGPNYAVELAALRSVVEGEAL